MKVLIVGSDGFLGSHLALYAESFHKYEVVRADYKSSKNVKTVHLDLTSFQEVHSLLEKIRPEIIINCAGIFRASSNDVFYKVNCLGSVNIFESILQIDKFNPQIFIMGSAAEYGLVEKEHMPLSEDFPLNPVTHYGISKTAQTFNALSYSREGLNIYIGRFFNIIGKGLSEMLAPSAFAKQIAEIEINLKIKKINVGHLDAKRDFIDVSDAVKAVFLILEKGHKGKVYNICSGDSYSMKEVLNILIKVASVKCEISTDSNRMNKHDVSDIYGDYSEVSRDTGWTPSYSIESSLENLLDGWRERLKNG